MKSDKSNLYLVEDENIERKTDYPDYSDKATMKMINE
jgi:hypothetical protein